jgi:hypothetical protein
VATFLTLCRRVAQESGTISGPLPVTVTNQSGRLAKVVEWTATAWRDIQNSRADWLWMRSQFTATTLANVATYSPSNFGVADRWGGWVVDPDGENWTLYPDTVTGKAEEGTITFISWQEWRWRYDRGTQEPSKPSFFSFKPAGDVCLGPVPDGAYVVRGDYRKSIQELEDDRDVPEMPSQYHDVIVGEGLRLLAEHDEGELHIAVGLRRYRQRYNDLMRDQLPKFSLAADPLA